MSGRERASHVLNLFLDGNRVSFSVVELDTDAKAVAFRRHLRDISFLRGIAISFSAALAWAIKTNFLTID